MADDWPGPRPNASPAAAGVRARVCANTGALVQMKVTHRPCALEVAGFGRAEAGTVLLFRRSGEGCSDRDCAQPSRTQA